MSSLQLKGVKGCFCGKKSSLGTYDSTDLKSVEVGVLNVEPQTNRLAS